VNSIEGPFQPVGASSLRGGVTRDPEKDHLAEIAKWSSGAGRFAIAQGQGGPGNYSPNNSQYDPETYDDVIDGKLDTYEQPLFFEYDYAGAERTNQELWWDFYQFGAGVTLYWYESAEL